MAGYLGYKEPGKEKKANLAEARKMNSEYLASLPPRKNAKTLLQMPAQFRTPEMLRIIEEQKAACQTSS